MVQRLDLKLTAVAILIVIEIISLFLLIYKPFGLFHTEDLNPAFSEKGASEDEVDIILTGDIMLARRIEDKTESTSALYPFEATLDYLNIADLRIGNLECVLSKNGELIDGRDMPFRAHPDLVEGLVSSDFDVLTLANNHILDYTAEALNDTIDVLNDEDIKFTGLYSGEIINNSKDFTKRPIIIEENDFEFAFLSYAHDPPSEWDTLDTFYEPIPLEESLMSEEINYTKKEYPEALIIIQIHWRISPQYEFEHTSFQEEICHKAIDDGAVIVSCHGPHSIQEIEAYKGTKNQNEGLIFYSLGNYVFDLSHENSLFSMIAKVRFDEEGIDKVSLLPIYRSNCQYQPAGVEKVYSFKNDLFLEWDDMEEFYTFNFNSPYFHFNLGTILGVISAIPLFGILILKKKEIINKLNKL